MPENKPVLELKNTKKKVYQKLKMEKKYLSMRPLAMWLRLSETVQKVLLGL